MAAPFALVIILTAVVGVSAADAVGGDGEAASRSTVTLVATDVEDTAGRLDISHVRHRVVPRDDGPARVTYEVRTVDRFSDASLSRRQRHFVIELDLDRERGSERNITVYARHGQLRADLISNASREVLTELAVARRNDRTIVVRGTADEVGARKVFWTSNFHRTGVRRPCGWSAGWPVTCQDTVPDRGWFRLDRSAWPSSQGVEQSSSAPRSRPQRGARQVAAGCHPWRVPRGTDT